MLNWKDVVRRGSQAEPLPFSAPNPQDVFSVSFSSSPSGELQGVQLTHENLTAGVAATRNLLPLSSAMSSLDTIVSSFPMNSPYGRAVAYTAVYEGTSFATLASTKLIIDGSPLPTDLGDVQSVNTLPIPSPTVLFIKPSHLSSLTASILEEARKSAPFLYSFAWRHKFASVFEGFLTKQSLWDRLVFDHARGKIMGRGAGTVRAVVVSGGPIEAQSLVPSRIALSVPLVNVHSHPLVAGPVFASHPLDLQTFTPAVPEAQSAGAADAYAFTYLAPVGPPSVNVEAKLFSVDDAAIEGGADPCGALYVRGPTVGTLLQPEIIESEDDERWVNSGERAKVSPNGTFKVVPVHTTK